MMKTKKVFFLNLSIDDEIFVKASEELNLTLFACSTMDPIETRIEAKNYYRRLPFNLWDSAFDRKIPPLRSRIKNLLKIYFFCKKNGINKIIKTPRYSGLTFWPLLLVQLFGRKLIRLSLMGLHWDKSLYTAQLEKNNIKVPRTYRVVEDSEYPFKFSSNIKYPCIAKPAYCSGGNGVMIAYKPDDLEKLFSLENNPQNFGELNLFYRNTVQGKKRNYIYNSGILGGPYLIQEFIPGRLFSVSAVWIRGKVSEIFCYEIGSYPNEYCAEQSFSWPIPSDVEKKLLTLSTDVAAALNYPDGPFMLDVIHSEDGKLYVIDAGPRASITGARLAAWVYESNHHAKAIIAAHFSDTLPASTFAGRAVFWQRFPFPKGKLAHISYPSNSMPGILALHTPLNKGDSINEPRLDRQMDERGWLVTTGKNLAEATEVWQRYYQAIDWNLQ